MALAAPGNPLVRLMNALLYLPSRDTPERFEDLTIETEDGERLHGWWVPARAPTIGHVLLCHGNAGNIGDRIPHVELLSAAGFDVLAFDYRGYGRSSGRPSEHGTYLDARAARERCSCGGTDSVDLPRRVARRRDRARARDRAPARRSGPAVDVHEHPRHGPAALSVHPARARARRLSEPAGSSPACARRCSCCTAIATTIVPLMDGEALFEAAPGPKRIEVLAGGGHNDLVGPWWIETIKDWWT